MMWLPCVSDDALRQDPQAAKDQEGIANLNQRIAQSMRRVEKRRKQIQLELSAHLPVSNRLEDITKRFQNIR